MRSVGLAVALTVLLPTWHGPSLCAQETGAAVPASPKEWVGRYEEYERFLETARVEREEDVPIGVTKPTRVFFEPGGLAESAIVKALRPGRESGYFESYQSEIAAYELDKLLGLDMVPPTVERIHLGARASAQLWLDGLEELAELQRQGEVAPNGFDWLRQVRRFQVWVNLVANVDANEGNNLVRRTPNWHLVLVDHSRAFTNRTRTIVEMTAIDRPFFERLKALDEAMLADTVAPLVLDGSRSILRRRDDIVKFFEELAAKQGEARVFTP